MKIGGVDINRKVGGVQVNEVRLGSVLIWSSFVGLLDTYANASVGYSLRKLRNNYSGSAIRVRRTDNTEQDIGFVNNVLDTVSLLYFVGSGDGFVSVIYDQHSSNNMIQSTASLQGVIVSSGVVNVLNGKPIINRSSSNNGGYLSTYAPNDGATVKGMYYIGKTSINESMIFGSNTGANYGFNSISGSSSTAVDGSSITLSNTRVNGSDTTIANRGDAHAATSSQFLLNRNIDFNFTNNNLGLGYRQTNPIGQGMFSFQEMVIFENTTDTVGKENNINDHYSIYGTLLLDLYPDAAAAYSLRRLRTAYSGSAVRVRRTDNTEQDIGFANNELDTVSLLSFVGSGNGFIVTWYDQSGNSNDVTNSTASLQPQVVSSGVVETLNSKPTALANSSILLSSATTITDGSGQLTTFSVSKPTTATTGVLFGARSAGALLGNFPKIISTGNIQNLSFNTPSGFTQSQTSFTLNTTNLFTCFRRTGNLQNYVNGSEGSVVSSGTPLNGDTAITIFARSDASLTEPFDGYGSEFIIYPKDSTTDRAAIETNINDYYSIYNVDFMLKEDGDNLLLETGDKIIL